jgi:hypothetical protein
MATTTPNYGWDVPTSTDYVKDGAVAIETLGDDIDASMFAALGGKKAGLALITSNTINTSALLVDSVFSSAYTHYRILLHVYGAGNGNVVRLTLKNSGGEVTTGYYSAEIGYDYATPSTSWTATGSTASWQIGYVGNGSSYKALYALDLANPFATDVKTGAGVYSGLNSGSAFKAGITNMATPNTTSCTGFYIRNSGATTLTGDYSVYGYNK